MSKTKIQWTDAVWKPCHEGRLEQPLRWRKPRRVFVHSMSDLFHEDVPDEFIDRVFAVMALSPQHTFQVLTKRPERMRAYLTKIVERPDVPTTSGPATFEREECIRIALTAHHAPRGKFASQIPWPLPNVWLGVSCENQETADERIPILLDTPAAVRFVSAEPLLGPIDFRRIPWPGLHPVDVLRGGAWLFPDRVGIDGYANHSGMPTLDWLVCGGATGPKAFLCDVAWIRSIVEQCREAGVPPFVKQLGAKAVDYDPEHEWFDGRDFHRGGKTYLGLKDRKGGDPAEWPEDLRVREFPAEVSR